MKRTLAFWGLLASITCPVLGQSVPTAEIPASSSTPSGTRVDMNSAVVPGSTPRVYRDPRTGRWMKQELQMVDVPVTRWQRQWVDRTVNTPQTTLETRLVPQTLAVPKTDQVLQPKIKNSWNPFAQPVYAYEHVPVTRYEPQTQLTQQQVPVTRWVSRVEKVPVDQPIQSTEKQPRWVISEVTDPAAEQLAAGGAPSMSSGRPLASQWAAGSGVKSGPRSPFGFSAPASLATPANNAVQMATAPNYVPQGTVATQYRFPFAPSANPANNYRSIMPAPAMSGQSNYRAPLNVATQPMGVSAREAEQAGLPPTIVR